MGDINDHLLDNNIVSIAVNPNDGRYPGVLANLRAVSGRVVIPTMAIAEIQSGLAKSNVSNHPQRAELDAFLLQYPLRLDFDEHAIEPYALVRGQLWRDYGTPKKNKRGHEEKLPEELVDRVTGKNLGIDERDLLIASVAIAYNLVLATNDQNEGMRRIKEAADKLESAGKPVRLRIDHWPR